MSDALREAAKGDEAQEVALDMWEQEALPVVDAQCMTCHDGSMPDIGFLAGTTTLEKRDTLINSVPRVVNLGTPEASRLLTKGTHSGPPLEAVEAMSILKWIWAEADARPHVAPVRTTPMPMALCESGAPGSPDCPINTIDLSSLGVAGTFELVVSRLAPDAVYITNMKFKAGAAGLRLEHPLLESWASATEPTADLMDRFFAVQLDLAPNGEAMLGTGDAGMLGWVACDPISVRFDVIE